MDGNHEENKRLRNPSMKSGDFSGREKETNTDLTK